MLTWDMCSGLPEAMFQVQQRGVGATKAILLQLLEGMNEQEAQPVLIIDMFPSRQGLETIPVF